jgi:hypothetical protein
MSMIINPYQFAAAAVTYNDRAQYLFDQLNSLFSISLGATHEGKINDFFDELIANGTIDATDTSGATDLVQALYLFDTGSANATKLNALRPLDTDAAFRITYGGGWSYASTGADPNGSTAYANTHYNPSTQATIDGFTFGVYSRTDDKSGTQVYGCYDSGLGKFAQQNFSNENMFTGDIAALLTYSRTTTQRLFVHTRRSNSDSESYQDGTSIGTNGSGSNSLPDEDFYFAARNGDGTAALFSGHELSIGFLTNVEFSDSEVTAFNTAVNNYAVARGWNV